MKNNTLLLILHKVMNRTKESMAYTYKIYMQDSSLSKEQMEEIINDKYHEYRTFLKCCLLQEIMNKSICSCLNTVKKV